MRRIPLMVGLLALVSIYVSAAPKQTVAVAFETSRVTVSGVSPGGNVLLYGLGRDFVRVSPELLRWAKVEAASTTDGTATFDIGRAVPARSVWIVVDVSTGAYAVATPQASFRRERAADQCAGRCSRDCGTHGTRTVGNGSEERAAGCSAAAGRSRTAARADRPGD